MDASLREARCVAFGKDVSALRLDVRGAAPGRPGLRLELRDRQLRLVASPDVTLAWFRIGSWWDQVAWLAAESAPPMVLPPIDASRVRALGPRTEDAAWWKAWARELAGDLEASARSPLFDGVWALAQVPIVSIAAARPYPRVPDRSLNAAPPPAHSIERVLKMPPLARDDWACGWGEQVPLGALFPLRAPSPAGSGRIKAWRKRARDGTLPPVLLQYLSTLGAYLIVDGHDRLHAALLEGAPPPLLGLWRARDADGLTGSTTFAWPDRRGALAWKRDAEVRLRTVTDVDPTDVEFLLGDRER